MERLHKNKSRFEVNIFWDELWKSTLKIPSQNRKIIGKLWDLWTEVSFLFLLIGISRVGKTLDRSVLLKTEVTFFFYRKQKCPFFNFYGPEVSFSQKLSYTRKMLAYKFYQLWQKNANWAGAAGEAASTGTKFQNLENFRGYP